MTNVIQLRRQAEVQTNLSDEQCQQIRADFKTNGFAVIRNLVPREPVLQLRGALLEAFNEARGQGALFSGGGLVSGHINCFPGMQSKFVQDRLEQVGLIDLVKDIFPKAVGTPNIGCNFNLPGSVAQHYHTDRPFTRDFVIVNIALADTVVENGAIDVLPGTHQKFYPYWRFGLNRLFTKTTRLPMEAGDVLVRTSNLWHRGMPNLSSVPRPMMALTWEDGGNFGEDPFLAHEGQVTFVPNWFRPTWQGRVREKVFVKAPLLYSTYRFVDSILTNKGY